ncbi:hypothetical protein [Chloroherpeton thalassium]|uniref:hypothetical protein n=1 Tax=Chloroherpeton thalassium TaxID=100716 RepID=UPI00031CDB85|nr:hypothetical protein [Chloroherpeton thalassium]
MTEKKPSIEEILASIEKGERLGLPEARRLLDAANKFFNKKDLARFLKPQESKPQNFRRCANWIAQMLLSKRPPRFPK